METSTDVASKDSALTDVLSMVQRLGHAQVLSLSEDLFPPSSQNVEQLIAQLKACCNTVAILRPSPQVTAAPLVRVRLQAQGIASLLPMPIPFLKTLVETHRITPDDAAKFQVAFDEALTNAVDHGCLELDSRLRANILQDGRSEYEILRDTRIKIPRFGERPLWISFSVRNDAYAVRIRDSGHGFEPEAPLPASVQLDTPSGRGLMLMRNFTDTLHYKGCGNQVSLIKSLSK